LGFWDSFTPRDLRRGGRAFVAGSPKMLCHTDSLCESRLVLGFCDDPRRVPKAEIGSGLHLVLFFFRNYFLFSPTSSPTPHIAAVCSFGAVVDWTPRLL